VRRARCTASIAAKAPQRTLAPATGLVVVDADDDVAVVRGPLDALLGTEPAPGTSLGSGEYGAALTRACEDARRSGQARLELDGGRLCGSAYALGDGVVALALVDGAAWRDAEDRARRSEELVELFFEHAPDIVTILEPDLIQRRVEGSVGRLLGYERGATQVDGLLYVHPDDRETLVERARQLTSRERTWLPPARYRVRSADGGWRWIETTTSDLRETELGGFLVFARDVTDHELEIRANAEAKARIEALVTSFHDPMLLVDAEGTIVLANDAYLRLYGLERSAVVGLPQEELWARIRLRFRSPEDFERRARDILTRDVPTLRAEMQLKDGRFLEVDHVPVVAEGELLGRVWVTRDVSAERAAAEQRRRLLELERTARRLAQQRVAELSRVDAMRRTLVSTVSHELRTPLTSIISHLQLVTENADQLDPEDASAVAAAERNAKRLQRLVDELLDIDRMGHHRAELTLAEVRLDELVREAVEGMAPVASRRGITLFVDAVLEGACARVDEGRIRQVVDNLLSNAINYNQPGGRAEVRLRSDDAEHVLEVVDDGAGIAAEHAAHVFEPFYRAVGDASAISGTGLGLSIARAIVEAHGGAITCASALGVGSTFTVRLPRAEEQQL
jgi:PAS domain S-box-containing protein